ncbi:ribosomal protein S18-alanine N-acetyltransferase [Nocardioides caldifontis]|uniref:ribosomal protein S18-alanine N-acetyltransferase n=1 Tax=Nocardioides caldifontis TaxID=2588938 RepID=UPI0011DF89A7|nr:ribosomal protein S18-alanine N-acetyltransferase [Nocardioides caldifontis]
MRLRPATASDVPAVTALEQELFGVDAWTWSSVAEELTGPRRTALVAAQGDDVLGYAVTLLAGDVVDLQRIGVVPAVRRTGVASRLLTELMEHGRRDGADRMLLEVSAGNAGALAFYVAAGFVEIDRRPRYYRDGTDAVVLRASLGTASCGRRTG